MKDDLPGFALVGCGVFLACLIPAVIISSITAGVCGVLWLFGVL